MKKLLFALFSLAVVFGAANADVYVHGYTRSNGSYVQGHYRSNPDGIRSNNYSYHGNVNPHTGSVGHSW